MAEAIGVASSIAGLVALVAQITQLSYSYVVGVKNAPRTQKRYIQEISAFMDVLLRADQVSQDAEELGLVPKRPTSLSECAINDCIELLSSLKSTLERNSRRLLWPILEKELRSHIEGLERFRLIFSDFVSANIL